MRNGWRWSIWARVCRRTERAHLWQSARSRASWSPSKSWPSPTRMRSRGNRIDPDWTRRRMTPSRNEAAYWAVRRYRDRHRAQWLCIYCSRPNDGMPSSLCRVHRRENRERARRMGDWGRIKNKPCQDCGRSLSREAIRRRCKYCLACRTQRRQARRQTPAFRRWHAAYELARQNRLIAAGLCAQCQQPRTGRRFCRACLDKINKAWRHRREAS